jgi:hypothetical protein
MGYLIILAGFIAIIGGAYWKGHSAGYDSAKADDEPVLQRLRENNAKAEAANETLQGDVNHVRELAGVCNARVTELSKIGETTSRAVNAALAKAERDRLTFEARVDGYAKAASTPSTKSKEQQCDAVRNVLGDVSDRMREVLGIGPDVPAAAAPASVPPSSTPAAPVPVVATPAPGVKKPLPPAVRMPPK